jgi:hypothetical protein
MIPGLGMDGVTVVRGVFVLSRGMLRDPGGVFAPPRGMLREAGGVFASS